MSADTYDLQAGATVLVLMEVADERLAQDAKWGQQNHECIARNGWGHIEHGYYIGQANRYKALNDARAKHGVSTWDSILLEEVFEAYAERDPVKRRAELVQAAAVIVAEIECIDRKLATV